MYMSHTNVAGSESCDLLFFYFTMEHCNSILTTAFSKLWHENVNIINLQYLRIYNFWMIHFVIPKYIHYLFSSSADPNNYKMVRENFIAPSLFLPNIVKGLLKNHLFESCVTCLK